MTMDEKHSETETEARSSLLEPVRKILLAAIGAVALAQEELEDFVNKLVERGEIAERDGKTLLRDVSEKRVKQTQRAQAELDERIAGVLRRMNLPTRSDVDAISAKIIALNEKLDQLD
jgi:poly(hydroxyalkanoate) granule-associated protein